MVTSSVAAGTPLGDQLPAVFHSVLDVPVQVLGVPAVATYGPTTGPPLPTGAAPAGSTGSVAVSPAARARFSRPLPVDPAALSALRASRPTITPLVALESAAFRSAAEPATSAADADVPVMVA